MDRVRVGRSGARAGNALMGLKGRVAITQEQEAAWKADVASAMELAIIHGGVMDVMGGNYATALAAAEARAEFMEKLVGKGKLVLGTFKTLYEMLSDEQKTKVNRFFGIDPGQTMPH